MDIRTDVLNLEASISDNQASENKLASLTTKYDDLAARISELRASTTKDVDSGRSVLADLDLCPHPDIADSTLPGQAQFPTHVSEDAQFDGATVGDRYSSKVADVFPLERNMIDEEASDASTCTCAYGIVADSSERSDSCDHTEAEKKEESAEANLSLIGLVGPSCKTIIVDSVVAQSVPDVTCEPESGNGGWAPEEMQLLLKYTEQVQGIFTLSQTLNGDVTAMLQRYRSRLETGGGDVVLFDQAVAMLSPMQIEIKLPTKKKSKGRRR